jgi:hypothetical protein
MFGQVLDKLANWLTVSFLLSSFFPWLVFSAANVAMAYVAFPVLRPVVDRYIGGEPGDKAVVVVLLTGGIAVLAYITSPLIQFLTGVLEGRYLPPWLTEAMTIVHADELMRLQKRKRKLLLEREKLRRRCGRNGEGGAAQAQLFEARTAGIALRQNRDPEKIKDAIAGVDGLHRYRRRSRLIETNDLEAALGKLTAALNDNCAEAGSLIIDRTPDNMALSGQLDEAFDVMVKELCKYAVTIASELHAAVLLDQERRFGTAKVEPTRLGNYAAALKSYCDSRYGFDFDFFWPRLLLTLQKDEKRSAAIVNANIQLNFTIWLVWLTVLFTGTWLPILSLAGHSLNLFVAVAVVGPLAAAAWLGIAETAYAAFADTVRSVVDLNRLDLLSGLQRPLPDTTLAERRAWERVALSLMYGERNDAPLKHP